MSSALELAEAPAQFERERPGFELVRDGRFTLLMLPLPDHNPVQRIRLEPDGVEAAVEDVRALLRARGRVRSTWWVSGLATPPDVVERLLALGLVPADEPPDEPRATAMVLDSEPPAADLEVRPIASLEEMRTAMRIDATAFGLEGEAWERWVATADERWRGLQEHGLAQVFLAFLDGRAVGSAQTAYVGGGGLMMGGAVLPEARRQGVYRALVRARWDDAVARGTPVLVTHAGAMSRPILERLGLHAVTEFDVLVDRG